MTTWNPNRWLLLPAIMSLLAAAGAQNSGSPAKVGPGTTAEGTEVDEGESDELLMFEEMPIVVTATRTPTPLHLAPVPVSIISAEDIRFGGMTDVPEMLQFVSGIDMLRYDRMRHAVGIRGLHEAISDRTLTLINGRNASSSVFGGSEFFRFPIFMPDIERIEVVRGPGGAAWGANAFNGVINIITKKPEDVTGGFIEAGVTHFGDHHEQLRWAGVDEEFSWRLSAGYQNTVASDDALNDSSFDSRDHWDAARVDTEFHWQTDATTRFSAGAAYSYLEQGVFDSGFFAPPGEGRQWNARLFARMDQELSAESSGYVQIFSNLEGSAFPSLADYSAQEYDLEGQLNLAIADDQQLTLGANIRYVHITESSTDPQQAVLLGEPFDEYWAGLFVIDRHTLSHGITFETQLRGDYYSETEFDWSGRMTAILVPDAEQRHASRISIARAFRAPLTGFRTGSLSRLPMGGNFLFRSVPADLDNEEIYSFELGHTYQPDPAWRVRADIYYQRFEDLIGLKTISGPAPQVFSFANLDGADGYGAELALDWQGETTSVSAWYTFHEISTDRGSQSVRALLPARHKAGITARAHLPAGFTCNLNYKYNGANPSEISGRTVVGEFHRLDLTLTKSILDGRGDVQVGVADLLNDTKFTVPGTGGALSPSIGKHETPGIMFFASMRIRL